jgi:hypothetical protein
LPPDMSETWVIMECMLWVRPSFPALSSGAACPDCVPTACVRMSLVLCTPCRL